MLSEGLTLARPRGADVRIRWSAECGSFHSFPYRASARFFVQFEDALIAAYSPRVGNTALI